MNQKHSKEYKSIGQTIKKYRKLRGLTPVTYTHLTLPTNREVLL